MWLGKGSALVLSGLCKHSNFFSRAHCLFASASWLVPVECGGCEMSCVAGTITPPAAAFMPHTPPPALLNTLDFVGHANSCELQHHERWCSCTVCSCIVCPSLSLSSSPGRSQDDQVADLMSRIFEAKLMAPADRKFKKAKPGKKKLVKWPKTLEHVEVGLPELLCMHICMQTPMVGVCVHFEL